MPCVIASGAKQSHGSRLGDCFVATLLAMTRRNIRERLLRFLVVSLFEMTMKSVN